METTEREITYKIPKGVVGPPGAFIWIEVDYKKMVSWVMKHTDRATQTIKRNGGPLVAMAVAREKLHLYRQLKAPSAFIDQKAFEIQALNQWLEYGERGFRRFFRDELEKRCKEVNKSYTICREEIEHRSLKPKFRTR